MTASKPQRFWVPAIVALLLGTLTGCPKPVPGPGTTPPRATGPKRITMEPIQFVAKRTAKGYQTEAFSAEDLFDQALGAQRKGRFEAALPYYDKVIKYFGTSPYGPPAHYNKALCLQRVRRWRDAAFHFEKSAAGLKQAGDAIAALGAAGVNYAEAASWADSRRCFAALLGRRDLTTHQRIEAHVRYGLSWFKSNNFSKASAAFGAAVALYRKTRATERLPTLFYVAMAVYHKAAIYHALAKRTPLRLPVEQMQQDVEAKATWTYKAQRAYWEVVKLKNHFWALAAVYQVGTLYWEFRQALLAAPVPKFHNVRYFDSNLKAYAVVDAKEQRTEYFRKLGAKTKVLLGHAMTVYRKGIATAERIGAKNKWAQKMRKAYAEVKAQYAKAGTDTTPPPEAGDPGYKPPRSPLTPPTIDPKRYRPTAVEL